MRRENLSSLMCSLSTVEKQQISNRISCRGSEWNPGYTSVGGACSKQRSRSTKKHVHGCIRRQIVYLLLSIFLMISILKRFTIIKIWNPFRLISLMCNFFSPVKVSYLGCYAESPYYNRMFPKVYLDYRFHIDWSTYPNMSHVVGACTRRALVRKYTYFAITNYGVCVWGPNGKNVARIAHSSPWCFRGLGGFWLVSVYKIDVSSSSKTFGKKKLKAGGHTVTPAQ